MAKSLNSGTGTAKPLMRNRARPTANAREEPRQDLGAAEAETTRSRDYIVGYGRPPHETRFQRGVSGNPQGRPKGTRNFRTDLEEVLNEMIPVREGGKEKKVSKQFALTKTLVAKALGGDQKAAGTLINLLVKLFPQDPPAAQHRALDEDEEDILKHYRARVIAQAQAEQKSRR